MATSQAVEDHSTSLDQHPNRNPAVPENAANGSHDLRTGVTPQAIGRQPESVGQPHETPRDADRFEPAIDRVEHDACARRVGVKDVGDVGTVLFVKASGPPLTG